METHFPVGNFVSIVWIVAEKLLELLDDPVASQGES